MAISLIYENVFFIELSPKSVEPLCYIHDGPLSSPVPPINLFKSRNDNVLTIFEHTCAYARWAYMHRFASVRLSVCDLTKIQTR